MRDDIVAAAPPPRLPVLSAGGERAGMFPVGRIFCVGRNYGEHAREMGGDPDLEPPFFFMKPASCVVHGRDPVYPPLTSDLHHEVELVVAIGTDVGRPVVVGCAVGVDLTRRDRQAEMKASRRPWEIGKVFVDAAPCGALRQGDEQIVDAHARISLDVDGQARQRGVLAEMIHDVPAILGHIDAAFGLAAGDLVFTGTPAGVGPLARGERVEARIDGLPPLAFTVA